MQRAVAIIPARYNSSRFTGKALALLKDKPLIQHVYENVSGASLIDTVLVATDDKRIYTAVQDFGGTAVMTSETHKSGTDRITEAARDIDCEYVVNVQGDEPFIMPEMVDDVVGLLSTDKRAAIGTLATRITDIDDIVSPDVVKVVIDQEGFALYFSRAPIPYMRDTWMCSRRKPDLPAHLHEGLFDFQAVSPAAEETVFFKHIGIYGFRKETLLRFSEMSRTMLEMTEKLEQLRALAGGMKIKVKETRHDSLGIDTLDDLVKGEKWLNSYS